MISSVNAISSSGFRYNYSKYNSQSFGAKPKTTKLDTTPNYMSKASERYNLDMKKVTDEETIKKYEEEAIELAKKVKPRAAGIKKEVKTLYKNKGLKNGVQAATITEYRYPASKQIYKIVMIEKDSDGHIKRRSMFNPEGKLTSCDIGVEELSDPSYHMQYEHVAEQFEFDDENKEEFYHYTQDVIEPWERCNRANTPIYDRQGKILRFDAGKVSSYKLNTEICFPYLMPISETALYRDEEGKLVLFKNSRMMASGSYILI